MRVPARERGCESLRVFPRDLASAFQNLWRERRSAWAKEVQQDQKAVVFLGDSITQGWGGGLGAAFPGIKVANRGISGDTTHGLLIRLPEDVLALNPAAVVLLIGTNDLEEGATPEVVTGNVKLILAALKRHDARMPIVFCQVFPSSATKKRPADQIKATNALYLAAVKNDPQITYVEIWPLFADASGDAIGAEFPDLLHPNEAGYAKRAAALRPVFATLGFSETEEPFTSEVGFESLFNGRDLTGWGLSADVRGGPGERETVASLGSERGRLAVRRRAHQLRRAEGQPRRTLRGQGWTPRRHRPSRPIGVEGDRGQMEYRRIRIKVLPR